MEPRVAFTAVGRQVVRVDGGRRVDLGQDVVGRVTVGASRYAAGIAHALDLAVIGQFIETDNVRGKIVSLHHVPVAVTVDAGPAVEFPGLDGVQVLGGVIDPGVVETVTVRAGGGVFVSIEDGQAMTGNGVFVIAVALGAFLQDGPLLRTLGGLDGVDVTVAVGASKVLVEVVVVFNIGGGDFLVTTGAREKFRLFQARHVLFQVFDRPVAAQATERPVDRFREGRPVKEVIMAIEAVYGTLVKDRLARIR